MYKLTGQCTQDYEQRTILIATTIWEAFHGMKPTDKFYYYLNDDANVSEGNHPKYTEEFSIKGMRVCCSFTSVVYYRGTFRFVCLAA